MPFEAVNDHFHTFEFRNASYCSVSYYDLVVYVDVLVVRS
jgi:hypothetical protein